MQERSSLPGPERWPRRAVGLLALGAAWKATVKGCHRIIKVGKYL